MALFLHTEAIFYICDGITFVASNTENQQYNSYNRDENDDKYRAIRLGEIEEFFKKHKSCIDK